MNPINTIIGNHLAKRASDPSLYTLKYAKLTEGDSDDWLYLSPEDFEKEMNERIKNIGATVFKTDADVAADTKPDLSNNDDDVKEHIDQLNGVVKGVKEFMNMKSTIDGIEIDSDDDDDNDDNDKDDDSDDKNDNNKDEMFTGIDNINFNDIMEQLLKISSGESHIKNVNLNEYFSSDDDDDGDDDDDDIGGNVDKKNNNKNDKSNNDKKNNPPETLHGIKNVILSNDNDDSDDNVNDKDSDDEDSFYNNSENSDEDRSDDNDTDDDSDRDNLSENDHDDFMTEYSKYMEAELSSTTLAESFEKSENNSNDVDVEKNLLKYLMESHASQLGMPGPTTQLLSQLNLSLPLPPPMNTKDV